MYQLHSSSCSKQRGNPAYRVVRPIQLAYLNYARPTEKTKRAKDKLIALNNV